jgi:hypothetical protein
MMQSGIRFEAAQGIRDTTGQVFVWDGLHRAEAARMTGTLLRIHVQPGTRQDAEWLALSANQKHGLRRSRQDKQRVVQQALLHPYGAELSDREIARHCGVDHKTVGKIRKELETTGEIPQLPKRVVTKASGATYHIDTTNIGNGKKTSTLVSKVDRWPDNNRFLNLLSQLDEEDGRLSRINSWLDTLEAQLDLTDHIDESDETVLPITSMPVPEYA